MMKLLLVGGTGSLSTAVTQEALSHNIEVYMINRGNHIEIIPKNVHLVKADVRNKQLVTSLLNDLHFDAVIDFICHNPKQIAYSLDLLKSITDQYVFISSVIVYNISVNNNMCDENAHKIISVWEESVNKKLSEDFLKEYASVNNINYTIIRPATNYGNTRLPTRGAFGEHLFLIDRIIHGKPVITWHNGENRMNVTHVNDFAAGLVGLLGNKQAYNETFNIAGDETPSRNEILDTLSVLLEKKVKTIDIPIEFIAKEMPNRFEKEKMLYWDSISSSFSSQKVKSVVKYFKQNISLKDGLKMTLDYYQSHKNIEWNYRQEANYDRIIAKYARKNNISREDFNLHFIDYLNDDGGIIYFIHRHIHPNVILFLYFPIRVLRKIIRSFKKLIF